MDSLSSHGHGLLPQLAQQLETEVAAGALVAVDGGGHEDEVGAEQGLHQGQRDGRSLVDYHQLRLGQLGGVTCRWRMLEYSIKLI